MHPAVYATENARCAYFVRILPFAMVRIGYRRFVMNSAVEVSNVNSFSLKHGSTSKYSN